MTPAVPITGTVGGVFALSGTTKLVAKIDAFKIASSRRQIPFNGFGDAGESYTYDGRHSWAASVHGSLLAGSGEKFNPSIYTGTNQYIGSAYFQTDAAVTYSGSVKVQNVSFGASYESGAQDVTFTVVGQGPLNQT